MLAAAAVSHLHRAAEIATELEQSCGASVSHQLDALAVYRSVERLPGALLQAVASVGGRVVVEAEELTARVVAIVAPGGAVSFDTVEHGDEVLDRDARSIRSVTELELAARGTWRFDVVVENKDPDFRWIPRGDLLDALIESRGWAPIARELANGARLLVGTGPGVGDEPTWTVSLQHPPAPAAEPPGAAIAAALERHRLPLPNVFDVGDGGPAAAALSLIFDSLVWVALARSFDEARNAVEVSAGADVTLDVRPDADGAAGRLWAWVNERGDLVAWEAVRQAIASEYSALSTSLPSAANVLGTAKFVAAGVAEGLAGSVIEARRKAIDAAAATASRVAEAARTSARGAADRLVVAAAASVGYFVARANSDASGGDIIAVAGLAAAFVLVASAGIFCIELPALRSALLKVSEDLEAGATGLGPDDIATVRSLPSMVDARLRVRRAAQFTGAVAAVALIALLSCAAFTSASTWDAQRPAPSNATP